VVVPADLGGCTGCWPEAAVIVAGAVIDRHLHPASDQSALGNRQGFLSKTALNRKDPPRFRAETVLLKFTYT
jgi:hypothetical protein